MIEQVVEPRDDQVKIQLDPDSADKKDMISFFTCTLCL